MDLPVLNTELLSRLITWAVEDAAAHEGDEVAAQVLAEQFPEWGHWNQNVWGEERRNGVCDTAYCIAGQAVAQVGMGLVLEANGVDDEGRTHYVASQCRPRRFVGLDEHGKPRYELSDGETQYIPNVAQEALGLTDDERVALFAGENTIEQVVSLAHLFARVRGVVLDVVPNVAEKATLSDAELDMSYYWGDKYREFMDLPVAPHRCTCGCGMVVDPDNQAVAAF